GESMLRGGVSHVERGIAAADDDDVGGAGHFGWRGGIHRKKPDIRVGGVYVPTPACQRGAAMRAVECSHIVRCFVRRVELNVVIEVDAGSIDTSEKCMSVSVVIAVICTAIWVYLIAARGAYRRAGVRYDASTGGIPGSWPSVAAAIPARNESECIARSVTSLLRQDYRGPLTIVVVDDDSDDDTEAPARDAAAGRGCLHVIRTAGPAAGWT